MMPVRDPAIKVRALDILPNAKNVLLNFVLAYFAAGSTRLGIFCNKVLFWLACNCATGRRSFFLEREQRKETRDADID